MTCPRTACTNEAISDSQYGVLPCKNHQKKDTEKVAKIRRSPEFYTLSQQDRFQHQRDRYAKDILQPFEGAGDPNLEFVKAYPDKVKDYFTPEQLRKL